MPWSTRQLADLAGTSLRAVRHYHDIGLLPEPLRRTNGYKEYGVPHLIRVLQIKKFSDLGIPLARITELDGSAARSDAALRALDAELAAGIERQQKVRDEIARLLADPRLLRLADEPDSAAGTALSTSERDLFSVIVGLVDAPGKQAFAELIAGSERSGTDDAFEALPPDADEAARDRLARAMLPDHPALRAWHDDGHGVDADTRAAADSVQRTVGAVLAELYNPAQLDVLRRVGELMVDDSTD